MATRRPVRACVRSQARSASRPARIADIVGELKLFTRIGEGSVSCPVDVNRILQTAITLTSAELRRHARLEVDLGPLPLAPGAFVNLGHAFVNLLMNAAQAIASKVSSADGAADPAGPNVIHVETMVRDRGIVVRVEDTGIGIPEHDLPRIFDPFFKGEATGAGAGLGLAIARDMVQRAGGEIRVESRRGIGDEVRGALAPRFRLHDVRRTGEHALRGAQGAHPAHATARRREDAARPHHR